MKPENILLDSKDLRKLDVKITDFGFSCFFDPARGLDLQLGSPLYMAPEVIKGHNYNEKVDVWSIGVITYMLISGRNPFPGATKEDVKLLITRPEPVNLETPKLAMMSIQAKDFIMKSMEKEPRRRASAKQLLDHPWIKEMISQRPRKEVKKEDQIQIL